MDKLISALRTTAKNLEGIPVLEDTRHIVSLLKEAAGALETARPEKSPVFHCDSFRLENNPDNGADPWAHRSAGMRCSSCMWFVEKQTNAIQRNDKTIGRCRRHAPTMNGYPVVYSNDWCGDHKLDETKI